MASCADSQTPEARGSAVRDSAGIRIIESGRPEAGGSGRWATVDPEHTVEIGATEGAEPYLFTGVVQAFETATGHIVVADAGAVSAPYDIRVFDRTGAHLQTFGGKGEGPGEFRAGPRIRLVAPDTVLTWDAGLGRLTWFTLDGTIVREETVRTTPALPMVLSPEPWAVLPDGSVIIMDRGSTPDREERVRQGFIRRQNSLLIRPANSAELRTIGNLPGGSSLYAGSGILALSPNLFPSTASSWSVRATNPPSIVIADDPTGAWALSVYALDGARTGSIRSGVTRAEVTADIARNEQDRLLERTANFAESEQPSYRAVIGNMPMPDSTPAIGRIIVDQSDRVWVQRWTGAAEAGPDTYDVIDASGAWLGWIEVDSGLGHIASIGADHILFVWLDELDVPRVRRHAFNRTDEEAG